MAGNVRQPVDVASLERYITANVPEIKVPLDVKQVCSGWSEAEHGAESHTVWIRTVESNVPADR
jgi:hypothetical protein